jgi:hypothetical protein
MMKSPKSSKVAEVDKLVKGRRKSSKIDKIDKIAPSDLRLSSSLSFDRDL